jgi:hypothetical protein
MGTHVSIAFNASFQCGINLVLSDDVYGSQRNRIAIFDSPDVSNYLLHICANNLSDFQNHVHLYRRPWRRVLRDGIVLFCAANYCRRSTLIRTEQIEARNSTS